MDLWIVGSQMLVATAIASTSLAAWQPGSADICLSTQRSKQDNIS